MVPRVLTIAGSDSGGGAGIQADLKTIALLGGYGMSALTALTAQNTRGVLAIQPVPPEFVRRQMEAVLGDIGADAAKTGMLGGTEVVEAVCRTLRKFRLPILVVDPVMVSKNGARLLQPQAEDVLRRELLPLATVVTPNIPEAEVLTGKRIRNAAEAREAAGRIRAMGPRYVLVKGGHLPGPARDFLYDGKKFQEFEAGRIRTPHTHGTGCTLSAALAVELGRGKNVPEAVAAAKRFLTTAIRTAFPLGRGRGPVNHYGPVRREIEKYEVVRRLKAAFEVLRRGKPADLLPEVQSNLGFALPWAEGLGDVAAFPGRFVRIEGEIAKAADPDFGVSRHIAGIILAAMSRDPEMRSAMNVKFAPEILKKARGAGFSIRSFDRRAEPAPVKRKEGASLSWGVHAALKRSRTVPDIIFDRGSVGKEPMIRVLGRTPEEVAAKILRLR